MMVGVILIGGIGGTFGMYRSMPMKERKGKGIGRGNCKRRFCPFCCLFLGFENIGRDFDLVI